jgi:hypothetical protein
VEAIYAAAAAPAAWPSALQTIARVFNDVGANLLYQAASPELSRHR